MNNQTLLMYGVTGEKRPVFSESYAVLYSLGDQRPSIHKSDRFSQKIGEPSLTYVSVLNG